MLAPPSPGSTVSRCNRRSTFLSVGTPVQQALTAPLRTWPATLDAMTQVPRRDAAVLDAAVGEQFA